MQPGEAAGDDREPTYPVTLSGQEKAMTEVTRRILLDALADERKAEADYAAVIERFGPVRPFINIIRAERRHSTALIRQMERLGLAVPDDDQASKGVAPASLADACKEAVAAEIANIALYDRIIPQITDPALQRVLSNLQAASRDNHLPAFQRCLERETRRG